MPRARPDARQISRIADLRPQERNANRHGPRGMSMLESSMREDGYLSPLTVAADGEAIDGSARLEVSADVFGDVDPIVVHSDGTRPIVHVREDIPNARDPRAVRLSTAANRIGQVNLDWDPRVLSELKEEGALVGLFTPDELEHLLGSIEPEIPEGAGGDDFDPRTTEGPTRSRAGDIWRLGEHRLLVGDARSSKAVARLMAGEVADIVFTDPPYGVAYEGGTDDHLTIENDDLGTEGTRELVRDLMAVAPLKHGGSFYVCASSGGMETAFRIGLREAGLEVRQAIAWVKSSFVLGHSDYHYRHETILTGWRAAPMKLQWGLTWLRHWSVNGSTDYTAEHETLLYGWKAGAPHYFTPDRTQQTVWEFDKPQRNADHPTMKPVDLILRALHNSSRPGDVVYDCCCGSGSTIIAAERSARRCYAAEIDPQYADVTLRRWEAETDGHADRVGRVAGDW